MENTYNNKVKKTNGADEVDAALQASIGVAKPKRAGEGSGKGAAPSQGSDLEAALSASLSVTRPPLLKDVKKKDDGTSLDISGTATPTAGETSNEPSPSKSTLPLYTQEWTEPSDFIAAKSQKKLRQGFSAEDNPAELLAQRVEQSADPLSDVLFKSRQNAALGLPETSGETNSLAKQQADLIRAGDTEAITKAVKQQKQLLDSRRQGAPKALTGETNYAMPGLSSIIAGTDEKGVQEYNKAIDKEEEEVINAGATAIRKSVIDKYNASDKSPDTRKALGAQLRMALSDMGVNADPDNPLSHITGISTEQRDMEVIRKNKAIDQGTIATDAKKFSAYQQTYNYNNEAELLRSEQILAAQELNKQQAKGRDADPTKVAELQRRISEAAQKEEELVKNYPEIGNQRGREDVANRFAEYANKQGVHGTTGDILKENYLPIRLFAGRRLNTEEEIKGVAQLTGRSEEEVRKYASEAGMPSYLGRVIRGAAGVVIGSLQWANRQIMSPGEADIANAELEKSIYHTPKAATLSVKDPSTWTSYNLLGTTAEGLGQFAAYVALTKGAGGLGRGVGRGLRIAAEGFNAASEGAFGSRVGGQVLEAIAPKVGRVLNLAPEVVEGTSPAANLIRAIARGRELGSTYATGYASSYEGAYKEAEGYSDNEAKKESYARSVAFLNGVSELIFPDIDVAKKMIALGQVKQFVRGQTLEPTQKQLLGAFVANLGKTVGMETLEEYVPLIGQTLEKEGLFNYHTSAAEFMNQLLDTTLQTVVSSLPMGFMHGGTNASHYTKMALWEVAKTPERISQQLDDMHGKGVLSTEQWNEKKQMVNTMTEVAAQVTQLNNKGDELTELDKAEYGYQLMKQRGWSEEMKKADPDRKEVLQKNIDASSKEIKKILYAGVSSTAQRVNEIITPTSTSQGDEPTEGTNPTDTVPTNSANRPIVVADLVSQDFDALLGNNSLINNIQNDATQESPQEFKQGIEAENNQQQHLRTDERQQDQTQGAEAEPGANSSNSPESSRNGQEEKETLINIIRPAETGGRSVETRGGVAVSMPAPRRVTVQPNGQVILITDEDTQNNNRQEEAAANQREDLGDQTDTERRVPGEPGAQRTEAGEEGTVDVAQIAQSHPYLTEEDRRVIDSPVDADVIEALHAKGADVHLSFDEVDAYSDLQKEYAKGDKVLDIEGMSEALAEARKDPDNPYYSLANKLELYAKIQESLAQKSAGDTGNETVFGAQAPDETGAATNLRQADPQAGTFFQIGGGDIPIITPRQAKKISAALSKAFKGLKVAFLPAAAFVKRAQEAGAKQISGNEVAFVSKGKVYINQDRVRLDTPLHEIGGHILADWARKNQPELYQKMLEVAREAPASIVKQIKENYPDLEEGSEGFLEEVFATVLGRDGKNIERSAAIAEEGYYGRAKRFINDLYKALLNYLQDKGIISPKATFSPDEFRRMTLSDFSNLIGTKLAAGRRLSVPSVPDLTNFSDYGLLSKDDFVYDKWGNTIGIKENIQHEIRREKESIRADAVAYLLTADGSPTDLPEDAYLTVRTKRFLQWAKGKAVKNDKGEPKIYYSAGVTAGGNPFLKATKENSGTPVFVKAEKLFSLENPQHRKLYAESIEVGATSHAVLINDVPHMHIEDVEGLQAYFQAKGLDYDAIAGVIQKEDPTSPINSFGQSVGTGIVVLNPQNIKSAESNTTFSDEQGDIRYQRIGVNSRLTPIQKEAYRKAVQLEESGKNRDEIFLATGWFRNRTDKKWRYELPNDNVRFTFNGTIEDRDYTVGELLDYTELYEAHPEIGTMRVKFAGLTAYNLENKEILLNKKLSPSALYFGLRHEIQHAIQDALGLPQGSILDEGMAMVKTRLEYLKSTPELAGANSEMITSLELYPDKWADYFYRNVAGEREAAAVERRAILPDALRLTITPGNIDVQDPMTVTKEQAGLTRDLAKAEQRQKAVLPFDNNGYLQTDTINVLHQNISQKVEDGKPNKSILQSIVDLALEYQTRNRTDYTEFLQAPQFLEIFGVDTYDALPDNIRAITGYVLSMNEPQLEIFQQVVQRAMANGTKVLTELNKVQESFDAAGQAPTKRRVAHAINQATGKWEPTPVSKNHRQAADDYVKRVREWQPTTQGESPQQSMERHLKAGYALPEWEYRTPTLKRDLSIASMRLLIQQGALQFSPRDFSTIIAQIDDDPSFPITNKQAFMTALVDMPPFSGPMRREILRRHKRSGSELSKAFNLRREAATPTDAAELLPQVFGEEGEEIIDARLAIEKALDSIDVELLDENGRPTTHIQEDFEKGLTEEDADREVEQLLRDRQLIRSLKKKDEALLKDKKVQDEATHQIQQAMAVLQAKYNVSSKEDIIKKLREAINSVKC